MFTSNPSKYEPQYGGWCAYAMGSSGEKVEVDPETFKIIEGKLYLFYNAYFNNTLKSWNKDESNLKEKSRHQLGENYKTEIIINYLFFKTKVKNHEKPNFYLDY